MLAGSFDLNEIVEAQRNLWFIVPQFLGFLVFRSINAGIRGMQSQAERLTEAAVNGEGLPSAEGTGTSPVDRPRERGAQSSPSASSCSSSSPK